MEAHSQRCRLYGIVDNCSASLIEYTVFESYKNAFLPPNMTAVLQPIECAFGCLFTCALRRLLIVHVLSCVDKMFALPATERPTFKITQVVTAYAALKLSTEA